ncbi:GNAT family N-acetyltransferase [Candidatus Woesearchaeota archaeon]|nr:GNAT family N-acetyltransferase [Candidatus Woesearchaeota archaeon]
MNIIFREAAEKDYDAIIALHKSEDWGLDTPRALKNFQEQGNLIIVAELNEQNNEQKKEIIGKMDLMPKKRHSVHFLYVERLILIPNHRSKGIGKKFLEYAAAEAKKRNLNYVDVAVRDENEIAKKLYQGSGFEIIGGKVYMRKEIK